MIMLLLYILIILVINVEAQSNDYPKNLVKRGYEDYLQSFYNLKDGITNFFDLDFDNIKRRVKIVNKAIYNFFQEALQSDAATAITATTSKATTTTKSHTTTKKATTSKATTTTKSHTTTKKATTSKAATTTTAKKTTKATKTTKTTEPEASTETEAPTSMEREQVGMFRTKTNNCLDFTELVAEDGYRSESHIVVTNDGYLLTIHRLLPASPNAPIGKNGIVLLHHGLLGSSDDWLLLGPKKGLPYLFLKAGYDVWLANARGNKYSMAHVYKNNTDEDFWNFSWHEIGRFDLAATIDYIRERNNNEKLHYVGYSMGATALLVLLSSVPKYNYFLKIAVLIAPLVFMKDVKGPLQFLAQHYNPEILRFLGVRENSPIRLLPAKLANIFCKSKTVNCQNPLLLLTQKPYQNLETKIGRCSPGGGSVKTIIHYVQSIKSGQFRMFDSQRFKLGPLSIYNLNNIVLPIVVFSSLGDGLSTSKDVEKLILLLPKVPLYHHIANYDFNHLDFMWSDDADVLVYYLLLDILNQFQIINKENNPDDPST